MIPLNDMIVRLLWAALLGSRNWCGARLSSSPGRVAHWLVCVRGRGFFHDSLHRNCTPHRRYQHYAHCFQHCSGNRFSWRRRYFARSRRGDWINHRSHNFCGGGAWVWVPALGYFGRRDLRACWCFSRWYSLLYVENWIGLKPRYMLFRISSDPNVDLVSEVHQCFSSLGITLDNFQVSMAGEKNLIQFDADVSHRKQEKIFAGLTRPGVTVEMLPVERQQQA